LFDGGFEVFDDLLGENVRVATTFLALKASTT
jgi:hypothetical protein